MQLETQRLNIRYFRAEDITAYAPIAGDPDVMKFLGGPQTLEQSQTYLDEMVELAATQGLGRYAVELKQSGELIGFCGFRPVREFVDFGYRYAKAYWGQGWALEAAQAVRRYGLDVLKMQNMEAGAAAENVASVKILDQLGFKYREELIYDGEPAVRFRDIQD